MSKSRKKKSSKGLSTGTTLGALALIIAIGVLGLGLYQFILPPASEGPMIYSLSHDDIINLDGITTIDYLSELELTYTAQAGDSVLIEFTCQIYLDPIGGTDLYLHFDINGTIFPSSSIRLYTESFLHTTGYLRHYIESSDAGNFTVYIVANINDEYTSSYVRYSLVTATVYG